MALFNQESGMKKKFVKIASVSFDSSLLYIPLNNSGDTESKVVSHAIQWWRNGGNPQKSGIPATGALKECQQAIAETRKRLTA